MCPVSKIRWQKIPGLDRDAPKWLEPILQEMMVKEEERCEAHLDEIRNAATCVMRFVATERFQGFFYVCQECGCVSMSDMCRFFFEENASGAKQEVL